MARKREFDLFSICLAKTWPKLPIKNKSENLPFPFLLDMKLQTSKLNHQLDPRIRNSTVRVRKPQRKGFNSLKSQAIPSASLYVYNRIDHFNNFQKLFSAM